MRESGAVTFEKRHAVLEQTRATKMASSHHAYVRGATESFYQWLQELDPKGLPQGPQIWICGDCHIGNLGPLADAEGNIDVLIRDLDQTVIGNPAYDLIRLGLSLTSLARSSDLPGVATARILEAMLRGYVLALRDSGAEGAIPEPSSVRSVRRRASLRKWGHLARERIGDPRPIIPLGRRFWRLTVEERSEIEALFEQTDVRDLAVAITQGDEASDIELVDAAYWMKGCSSLGSLRYAAVVRLKGKKVGKLALIDFKEAPKALAPRAPGREMPFDDARRVVTGARALSPNLGERMIPVLLGGKPLVMRELAPQDLKLEIEQFSRSEGLVAAQYLAFVLGKAHVRQMDQKERIAWRQQLEAHDPIALNAPSWLWTSVVALNLRHEGAYLEHCRLYAAKIAQSERR